MGNEAIVIPIIIDPKAGVAGLKAVGDQAVKTNSQMGGLSNYTGKFGEAMKGAARNALAMFGAMNLVDGAVKVLVGGLIDAVMGANKLASSSSLLAQAQKKAAESTRDEVVQLQVLFSVAKDTTLSYGSRQAAIDQLNKQYPELHKNLTLENIANQEVAKSMQLVIDNMVKKAMLTELINSIAELTNKMNKLKAAGGDASFGFIKANVTAELDRYAERIKTLTNEAVKLQAATIKPKTGVSLLGSSAAGDVTAKVDTLTVKPGKLKIEAPKVELGKFGINAFDFEQTALSNVKIPKKKKYTMFQGETSTERQGDDTYLADLISKQQELLEMNERIAGQVSGVLSPAFEGLFDAIVNKQDALQAFFSAIGKSIKQLIKQLIQAAIQAAVLSLITGGSAKGGFSFFSAFKKITGFAEGGLVTGPVSALVGEGRGTNASNPEVIAPLDKLKSFFANMMGTNRGYGANSNMGTAGSIVSMPREVRLRMSGRELVGVIALETSSQGRTG
jgi:hypothetical protein